MQNRTDIVGVSLWERMRQTAKTNRGWLMHIGAAAMGFVLSNSYILGGLSPFGVPFCAAVPSGYTLSSGLGAILGCIFSINPVANTKYVAALLLVLAGKWLFGSKVPDRYHVVSSAAICFLSLAVSGIAVLISGDPTLYDVIIACAELLLACGATYFFARALQVLGLGIGAMSRSDVSCIIVTLAVVFMGLASIQVSGIALGRVLAVLVILICARHGREAGGAIAGITAGMALGLVSGNYAYVVVAYAFGGLVAGVFGGMGRIAAAASFIFINTITALFTMEYADVYNAIFEIFIATVLFIAIPGSWVNRLGLQAAFAPAEKPDTATQATLCERLDDISVALREISTTTHQVSEKLGGMEGSGINSVYTRVAEQVCYRCGLRTNCWQTNYTDTVSTLNDAMLVLKRDGTVSKDRMPSHFQKTCCKSDQFITALNTRFHDFIAKEGVQRKVSKVRGVVTDQFEGMALMLEEISGELSEMRLLNTGKTQLVREYLEKLGITLRQVICYTDEYDRISIEIQMPGYQVARLQKNKLTLDLCQLLEAEFDAPQVTAREQYTVVQISEKASYSVELGVHQISADNNRLCGDAYDFIQNKTGKAHLILSDGMGSGGSAAVDSNMASGLIGRLLTVGIGHEAALKMVNSALLIKSGEESLATIDISSLDLFTGKVTFYKAGAAPTFVIKNGKAGYVESTSLPAGILRGVAFEKSGITLHEGDMVVMVSDGVVATGADWVVSELESAPRTDMQQLCERLSTTAKLRRTDGHEDDITVMAALVCKGV